jgi:hypothetical protein
VPRLGCAKPKATIEIMRPNGQQVNLHWQPMLEGDWPFSIQ